MFIIYHKHTFQRRGSQDLINHQFGVNLMLYEMMLNTKFETFTLD